MENWAVSGKCGQQQRPEIRGSLTFHTLIEKKYLLCVNIIFQKSESLFEDLELHKLT